MGRQDGTDGIRARDGNGKYAAYARAGGNTRAGQRDTRRAQRSNGQHHGLCGGGFYGIDINFKCRAAYGFRGRE